MRPTYVKLKIMEGQNLKATISITIDGVLRIDRIGVIRDRVNDKLFISMPSVQTPSKGWKNVFHPVNQEAQTLTNNLLMQFYEYAVTNRITYLEMELMGNSGATHLRHQSIADFQKKKTRWDYRDTNEPSFSVTSIRMNKADEKNDFCAEASFVIDDTFALNEVKLIQDTNTGEYRLVMPNYETKPYGIKDIVSPICRVFREKTEKLLVDAYMHLMKEQKDILNASVLEENKKPMYMQEISDFDIRLALLGAVTDKETAQGQKVSAEKETMPSDKPDQMPSEQAIPLASLEESLEEKIYRDFDFAVEHMVKQDGKDYVSGKIVGYLDENWYKVLLRNGEIGRISCAEADALEAVVDYRNKIFSEFVFRDKDIREDKLLKHINQNYYFTISQKTDTGCILSIQSPKRDFLKYAVDNQCVLKGRILQIENGIVTIEIPFGFVFFTSVSFVFGCVYDPVFDYMNYLGVEVSVILHYAAIHNKMYPIIAQNRYKWTDPELDYIFPSLARREQGFYSKLWLDKKVLLQDNRRKLLMKHINQLLVVSKIREKGELKQCYKANIKKALREEEANRHRKQILAVQWLVNLRGHHVNQAVAYLEEKGFCYKVTYTNSHEAESGTVISMRPDIRKKTILPRNIVVDLTVSQGRRKSYVLPDLTGMHIKEVREILQKNKLGLKKEFSSLAQEGIADHCVIQTRPEAGSTLESGETVKVLLYQEAVYETPFALREKERLRIVHDGKVFGSDETIDQFVSVPWQREMLEFILKHKVVNSIHLMWWLDVRFNSGVSRKDFDDSVKYLLNLSLLSRISLENDISMSNFYFLFPRKRLYPIFKKYTGYNGMFTFYGKDAVMLKARAAENQAFIKLYGMMNQENTIQYEVDAMQSYTYEEEKLLLKIHIAMMAKKDPQNVRVFFIEAFRFLNEEQMMEGWNKLIRYNKYVAKKYDIIPNLILVFEDEKRYKEFMAACPPGFRFDNLEVLYTWDSLTNRGEGGFSDVFMKEETLCPITT